MNSGLGLPTRSSSTLVLSQALQVGSHTQDFRPAKWVIHHVRRNLLPRGGKPPMTPHPSSLTAPTTSHFGSVSTVSRWGTAGKGLSFFADTLEEAERVAKAYLGLSEPEN
jgi:hypothetical protein